MTTTTEFETQMAEAIQSTVRQAKEQLAATQEDLVKMIGKGYHVTPEQMHRLWAAEWVATAYKTVEQAAEKLGWVEALEHVQERVQNDLIRGYGDTDVRSTDPITNARSSVIRTAASRFVQYGISYVG